MQSDNITYDALQLKRNIQVRQILTFLPSICMKLNTSPIFQDTFFNIETPLSLLKRALSRDTQDLATILNGWEPWMTPNGPVQALQQGGLFVFQGSELAYAHRDKVRWCIFMVWK